MCHDEVDSLTDYLAKIIFESFSEMSTEACTEAPP